MLYRLEGGGKVSTKELKRAIGDLHWRNHQQSVAFASSEKSTAANASYQMSRYVKLLRIADLHESWNSRKNKKTGRYVEPKMQSDSKYEAALECLCEIITANPMFVTYLDRPFDPNNYGFNDDIHADKERVPRIKYHKKNIGYEFLHQQIPKLDDIKMATLRHAIAEPETEIDATDNLISEEQMAQMNALRRLVRR